MNDIAALQFLYAQLVQVFAQNPWLVATVFFAAYVLTTAASLPVATLLTLLAGGVFGFWPGVLLVSFAASLGATSAMLISRYFLFNWVQRKFSAQMAVVNDGIAKDGVFYLFALRFTPIVPFFVVNLLMGLTQMRAFTFYWVTQLGMLTLTMVYVNAGTQLLELRSLSDIVSPHLLGSLALAGIAPLLLKKVMPRLLRVHVASNADRLWRAHRPRCFDCNVLVIGAGAGGLVAAYVATAVKAKVTLVEAHKMGGDCLNYGCVPSKALIHSARAAHRLRHAAKYGLQGADAAIDFKAVMANIHAIIEKIAPHDSVERYTELGAEVLLGHAKILDPWTVEITLNAPALPSESRTITRTARAMVIAAGSAPAIPPFLLALANEDQADYLTSDTLWSAFAKLDEIPRRVIVLGGGAMGCELAQALRRLGAGLTLIEALDRVLPREDENVSALVKNALEADGVRVLTNHTALRAEKKTLTAQSPEGEVMIPYDTLICATGRVARLAGYGLEALGIATNQPLETNAYLQTIYPNIYLAGDVAGVYQQTHAAAHQAGYATVNALFGDLKKFRADKHAMPRAIFVDPEVACVGLNEREALQQKVAYEVTRYDLSSLDRAIVDGAAEGFVKVLTTPGVDKILGVTIVGAHAAEMLAEFSLAMRHGLGLKKILATTHIYPTFSEANRYAAGKWASEHRPHKLLALAQRFHAWRRR